MNGVRYMVDESGNRTAVILDLKTHRRLWEDIHDRLVIESRRREPRESLEQVKKRLSRRRASSKAHA